VNLVQIHSAIPEIFDSQTKKSQTALTTEPYAVYCVQSSERTHRVINTNKVETTESAGDVFMILYRPILELRHGQLFTLIYWDDKMKNCRAFLLNDKRTEMQ